MYGGIPASIKSDERGGILRVICALCEKPMGDLTGRIVKGWLVVHEDCLWPKASGDKPVDSKPGDMPDFLKSLFKGRL